MKMRATTTVSIFRGIRIDAEGDEVDTSSPVARGVRASIIEQSRRIFDDNDSSLRTIRLITARLPAGTDVKRDDRLFDEKTRFTYLVSSVTHKQNPVRIPDLELDLIRPD